MAQKQRLKLKKWIIGLLAAAALGGALLGKIAPMEAGFSNLFKKEKEAVLGEDSTNKTSENVGKIVTSETEEVQLSYAEQVTQEIQQDKFNGRINVPLLLQTEDYWKTIPYGTGENNTLEKNGCAIVSLAMVASYLDNAEVLPQEILDWSKNDYFIEGQGTSWGIFAEFAAVKGYAYENLPSLSAVEEQLIQGHPVIISVKPGAFTQTGHIMVLTGYSDGKFWLNDPNDNEEKGHSRMAYTPEQLETDAMNYWAIYK
ncbi:peptidase C39 family protein [Enterococcus sp. BWB1-3]|uniref:peptidase C39 family protein n=1 Tax=Enterococcus sp. BWB1-3 TaxID=2787713 RepID=UPI0019247FC6|nr:peptidase C39 family protein [Enterococcus sp. BWB1-3]MBL1229877.1 peptidase C39 family protein [Enterococcus sp. BWB1-3]